MRENKTVYGIQGGKGSFNDEAITKYLLENKIDNFEIIYLYNSENVLNSLSSKKIDFGQFAIYNTLGGLVDESLVAMSRYKFNIIDKYSIRIKHCMMVLKEVEIGEIKTFMAHPQVFKQCKNSLDLKYPTLERVSGEGDLVDSAKVAEELINGNIDKHVAVLGSEKIAESFGLKIVDSDLQDNDENETTFLFVK